jgi:hypothetical protein
MGGHGWAEVADDDYGLGMSTNLKENVGLCHIHNISSKTVSKLTYTYPAYNWEVSCQ